VVVVDGYFPVSVMIMVVGVVTSFHILACKLRLYDDSYIWGEGVVPES
jgi:hypothetical protein